VDDQHTERTERGSPPTPGPAAGPPAAEETASGPRAVLARERARALETLREGVTAPGPMTYGSQAAAASQVFEQQRDLALHERTRRSLEGIEAALRRLDEGTYGRCTSCGREIPSERLEALPWAALCIDCQRAAGGRAR
jgi:RNA polymerase-binding protein DksA